jgi:hypothetical protein
MYKLRRNGERLPEVEVRKSGSVGIFVFRPKPGGQPVMRAEFYGESWFVAHESIEPARILKVEAGILVTGWETMTQKQTWWCVPLTPPADRKLPEKY